jgi:hypothetical protein
VLFSPAKEAAAYRAATTDRRDAFVQAIVFELYDGHQRGAFGKPHARRSGFAFQHLGREPFLKELGGALRSNRNIRQQAHGCPRRFK